MRRILLVLSVAALMAAMVAVSAMPAFATHECTKDNRAGVQNAWTRGEAANERGLDVRRSVCYNAGGDPDYGSSPEYEDPGKARYTRAVTVD